jgi:tRNA/tmRNA/rRNA uracil-C5-methylase (TrmA/RlmC/RlmD family)
MSPAGDTEQLSSAMTRRITREEDVRVGLRLLQGVEPSEQTVAFLLSQFATLDELREAFLTAAKASMSPVRARVNPLDWERLICETSASRRDLSAMIRQIETQWRELGESKPFFSVLTDDRFRPERFPQHEEEFFRSGKEFAHIFKRTADRCAISLAAYRDCFELGCGVGRVTIELAEMFSRVIAADISASHLAVVRQVTEKLNRHNIDFLHLQNLSQITNIPGFDVFVCCNTIRLQ